MAGGIGTRDVSGGALSCAVRSRLRPIEQGTGRNFRSDRDSRQGFERLLTGEGEPEGPPRQIMTIPKTPQHERLLQVARSLPPTVQLFGGAIIPESGKVTYTWGDGITLAALVVRFMERFPALARAFWPEFLSARPVEHGKLLDIREPPPRVPPPLRPFEAQSFDPPFGIVRRLPVPAAARDATRKAYAAKPDWRDIPRIDRAEILAFLEDMAAQGAALFIVTPRLDRQGRRTGERVAWAGADLAAIVRLIVGFQWASLPFPSMLELELQRSVAAGRLAAPEITQA